MISLHFAPEDLGRIRFAFSPLWGDGDQPAGAGLARAQSVAPAVAGAGPAPARDVDLELLTAVVRPVGYIPDFLVPSPPHRAANFASGLAQVAAADPADVADVAAQLSHLAGHPVGQHGPGREARTQLTRRLAETPVAARDRIVAELDRYWRAAVAPYWRRIEGLLQADLAYRLQELAAGGVQQLFRTLHPLVAFDRDTLTVVKYYDGHADLKQRGLLLIPCVFAWPDVIVLTAEPHTPTVTYSPRGLGRLWETHPAPAAHRSRTWSAAAAPLCSPSWTCQ